MKRIVEHIEAVLKEAFLAAGYDEICKGNGFQSSGPL